MTVATPTSFVRTVLGDVPSADLGLCYAHEHIVLEESFPTHEDPTFLLNDVDKIVTELEAFRAAGGRAVIDSMPADAGRNVLKLADVSRRANIHIVAPTGLHLAKYYPPGHWSFKLSAERLASLFLADIEQGIDAFDYGCPIVQRTPHRAGIIKIASGLDQLSAQEKKLFEAAAIAHRATGCPILTHTEHGTAGLEQVQTLASHGVNLAHVCLSHLDRKPDPAYHREILSTGVKVEYDSAFRWKAHQPNHTFDLVVKLIAEFPDQIMLGMDAARHTYWKSFGGDPGLTFLLDSFVPKLKSAGLSDADVNRIFVTTPASTYSFAVRNTSTSLKGANP
jgi:predicted metal-dependent phosphotriesterase family hydrolase